MPWLTFIVPFLIFGLTKNVSHWNGAWDRFLIWLWGLCKGDFNYYTYFHELQTTEWNDFPSREKIQQRPRHYHWNALRFPRMSSFTEARRLLMHTVKNEFVSAPIFFYLALSIKLCIWLSLGSGLGNVL